MPREKRCILVSRWGGNERTPKTAIRQIPIVLWLGLTSSAASAGAVTLRAVRDGAMPFWCGAGLFFIFLCCLSSFFAALIGIRPMRRMDITKSIMFIPAWAVCLTFSMVVIFSYQYVVINVVLGESPAWIYGVFTLTMFVFLLPVTVSAVTIWKYGSKFRFFCGCILKVLYSRLKCRFVFAKLMLDSLKWVYGQHGEYPFLRGHVVSIKIEKLQCEKEMEEHTRYSFPQHVYASVEDIAEGCFAVTKYLVLTGELKEQPQRKWTKKAINSLNAMISNPRFYSSGEPVSDSTYKRTGRWLAEQGEALFRTKEDEYFETYR